MCLCVLVVCFVFLFFKQKTAYEMRISDWSSDVCSSDLAARERAELARRQLRGVHHEGVVVQARDQVLAGQFADVTPGVDQRALQRRVAEAIAQRGGVLDLDEIQRAARLLRDRRAQPLPHRRAREIGRATSELQSLMRTSYAVFCL